MKTQYLHGRGPAGCFSHHVVEWCSNHVKHSQSGGYFNHLLQRCCMKVRISIKRFLLLLLLLLLFYVTHRAAVVIPRCLTAHLFHKSAEEKHQVRVFPLFNGWWGRDENITKNRSKGTIHEWPSLTGCEHANVSDLFGRNDLYHLYLSFVNIHHSLQNDFQTHGCVEGIQLKRIIQDFKENVIDVMWLMPLSSTKYVACARRCNIRELLSLA